MHLIVGLGNPGQRYANNRHNVGFHCLNKFARRHSLHFDKRQGRARIGTGEVAGNSIIVAKPRTYMNRSGESVSLLMNRYHINLSNLVVIHDDLDLAPGKIRLSQGSSAGGHRGAESIIDCLDSQDFLRLRVGIGRPIIPLGTSGINEADIIAYVLSDFTAMEREVINQVISRVSDALYCLLTAGSAAAMNQFN